MSAQTQGNAIYRKRQPLGEITSMYKPKTEQKLQVKPQHLYFPHPSELQNGNFYIAYVNGQALNSKPNTFNQVVNPESLVQALPSSYAANQQMVARQDSYGSYSNQKENMNPNHSSNSKKVNCAASLKTDKTKYKTEMCKNWIEIGVCRYSNKC